MRFPVPPRWRLLLGLVGVLGLAACQAPSDAERQTQDADVVLPGDKDVLVRVNGDVITAYDLDLAIANLLGPEQAAMLDAAGRRKVLESLVMSRLMAAAAETGLTADERAELDKKIAGYREQLLAKRYLMAHAEPGPVTDEMVKQHYEKHPELFGGGRERHYQLLSATPESVAGREAAMQVLNEARERKDWPEYARAMTRQGRQVQFRDGVVDAGLLHPQLLALLNQTASEQVSAVTFIQGQAYVARISKEVEKQPRPLAEVSAEIRRMLIPVQMKKAVEQVSAGLQKSAKIEYVTNE
ncbi:MAG TPA: peptidylprolyl isomerase [Gammaproteobacteria bacterium]